MTKIFSLTSEDGAATFVHRIKLDESRLADAKVALAELDLLGCQERFSDFLRQLEQRWGWRIESIERQNTRPPGAADHPESFRRRIRDDNPLDMELYEFARTLTG